MKITLDQWVELEKLSIEAAAALSALNRRLTDMHLAELKKDIASREGAMFHKLACRVDAAQDALACQLYHIQGEWTGGDSSDPRNHTLREPNWVNIAHSFPPEQVDKYRDPETGDITIPHRVTTRD